MALWVFRCFLLAGKRDVMRDWYCGLSAKGQAKFDTVLEHLRDTPHGQWTTNWVFPLTGYDGIFEFKFRVRNIVHRPLGCYGPERSEFTFLIPAREHGNRFEPIDAPDIARIRQAQIKIVGRTHECNFEDCDSEETEA
jgi:hypothetical protein